MKKELSSTDVRVRNKAALALSAYGEDARTLVPELVRLLKDPNSGVRSSAAYALRSIGGEEAQGALEKATIEERERKNGS